MASTSQETTSAKQRKIDSSETSKKTTSIQVIHIPANSDSLSDPTLFAVEVDENFPNSNLSHETKDRLKQVPDLKDYCDKGLFDWYHRGLFQLVVPESRVPEEFTGSEGCYLMYKCGDSDCGLPFNSFFVGDHDAHVYGDAFLFKINGPKCDQSGEATFEKLGPNFLKSLREGTLALEILSTLSKL